MNIINACVILHNLIWVEAPNDPLLDEVDAEIQTRVAQEGDVYNKEEAQPHVYNEMEEGCSTLIELKLFKLQMSGLDLGII